MREQRSRRGKPALRYSENCTGDGAGWRYLPSTGQLQTAASPSKFITYCATAMVSGFGSVVILRPCSSGQHDKRAQKWQYRDGYIELQASPDKYAWSEAAVKPDRPPLLAAKGNSGRVGSSNQVKADGQKWTLEPVNG